MVRARRVVRKPRVKKTEQYDSDDPESYKHEEIPDKKSSSFAEDEIEEFHSKKISNLLAHGVQEDSEREDSTDEEEIMPLTIEDSEEEEDADDDDGSNEEHEETDMDSDLDGKKEDDLPNDMAWGRRKKTYYDSDHTAAKGRSLEEVEAEDDEEEEEAMNIQQRLTANLSEEDYDLNLLQEFAFQGETETPDRRDEKEQRIVKDLQTMSQKEKLKLLRKESPELLELIHDFKAKLTELRDEIQPLVKMVKDGRIPPGKGANYIITKQQLYLNYCTNISFYLVLKAKRIPAHQHPVIERLVTYRNLINRLGRVDAKLAPQLRQLLSGAQKAGASQSGAKPSKTEAISTLDRTELEEAEESDSDEEAALRFYRGIEARLKLKRKTKTLLDDGLTPELDEEVDEAQMEEDGKRGITYQMAKNKGLTPKRKKIDRNPRVKHREKYRRAKIRRKGQVREVRREETRYSGELSGIRAGVKKSIKLK